MNIFFLDYDPRENVKFYVNKHLIKMPLEYAQMLSTANRFCGLDEGYRITHLNHPCTIWTRECVENWKYLRDLAFLVNQEARYRGYNYHSSLDVIKSLSEPPLPKLGHLTIPPKCMPDVCKMEDLVDSYRLYYLRDKRSIADWGKRGEPWWWIDY